jgi:hypothetical protein
MGRLKLLVALGIVVGGFAMSAVAAVGPRGNHTELVTAVFAGQAAGIPYERTCAGTDGQYRQALELYAGGVGGDPRLNGAGALTLTTFTNTSTGNGTAYGTLVVTDVTTQQLRWTAAVQGVIRGSNLKGVMTGVVRNRSNQEGGRLIANFEGEHNGTSFYVGIGFAGTSANPAVIQGGACAPMSHQ